MSEICSSFFCCHCFCCHRLMILSFILVLVWNEWWISSDCLPDGYGGLPRVHAVRGLAVHSVGPGGNPRENPRFVSLVVAAESVDVACAILSAHGATISPAFAWYCAVAESTAFPYGRLRWVVVYCLLSVLFPFFLFSFGVVRGGGVCSVFGEGVVVDFW